MITRTNEYTGVSVHADSSEFVATTKVIAEHYTYNLSSIFDEIKKLSQDEYTGQGRFIFYVDDDNKLHFKPKPVSITGTVKEGIDIINYTAQKSIFNVVNWIAIDAGKDKNDASILTYVYDVDSIQNDGWLMDMVKAEQISGDFKKALIDRAEYAGYSNAEFIGSVRNIARRWGQDFLRTRGGWRWKGEFNMSGNDVYTTGDFLTFECPSVGWTGNNKPNLRVTDIKHSLDQTGWYTTIIAEEDKE